MFRIVGVTQAIGRIGVSSEYFGRPDTFQEMSDLRTVFEVYGQIVRNVQGSRARFPGEMTQIIRQAVQQYAVFCRRDPRDRTIQPAQKRCRADNVSSSAELDDQYTHAK